jgi:hypothetical protein
MIPFVLLHSHLNNNPQKKLIQIEEKHKWNQTTNGEREREREREREA